MKGDGRSDRERRDGGTEYGMKNIQLGTDPIFFIPVRSEVTGY